MKYQIKQDENALSPNEDGDTGLFLVANHRGFYVAEPGEKRINCGAAELVQKYKKTHHIFPIEAYIHSGVILALSHEGNFCDRQWDVSQVGFIFVAKSEWRLNKSARKAAESFLTTWNQYLSGGVWRYVIEDEEGNHLDSCGGFYGKDYCESEAKSAMKALDKAT